MTPPACRLCGKNHWAREGCQFAAIIKGTKHEIHVDGLKLPKGSIVLVSQPAPNKVIAAFTSKQSKPSDWKQTKPAKKKGKTK